MLIVENPSYDIPKNYMFVYFLGKGKMGSLAETEQIAKRRNLKIIDIFIQDFPDYYPTSPSEYLYLAQKPSYVCIDSYHEVVFAIIFHKSFGVCRRNDLARA